MTANACSEAGGFYSTGFGQIFFCIHPSAAAEPAKYSDAVAALIADKDLAGSRQRGGLAESSRIVGPAQCSAVVVLLNA